MPDAPGDVETHPLPIEDLHALVAVARRWADHGRLDDAQIMLEGLASLEPERAFLRTSLGCAYMRSGRNEDALASFEEASDRDPTDVTALTHAGELRLERGDRQRGLDLLSAAISLDPERTNPHANRARSLRALAEAEARA